MALDPNSLIYISYPRVNCLKTIPFTEAHIYLAHIWQDTPQAFCPRRTESRLLIHHNCNVQPVAIILRFCLVYMSSEKVAGVCLYYRI